MDQELAALDEMEYLLRRMLELAECSANDNCSNTRRKELQKGFELLHGLVNEAAKRCERGRTAQ